MCVESILFLCIHKVSFRGACYFFASVHGYDGARRLLNLIFTNVVLRTYLLDTKKTDFTQPLEDSDPFQLFATSLYYVATTVTALLIFRAVEKEWRQLMQWTATVFVIIEAIALSLYFVLNPDSYVSATSIATISARFIFVVFYNISLILYMRQLYREEKESEWKFTQSEWEPRFLGRSPGGGSSTIFANLSGFGSLGFGENTIKWLEAEKVIPHPQLIGGDENGFHIKSLPGMMGSTYHKDINNNNKTLSTTKEENDNSKFEVRYEVCKSTR